jgi:hypothetical protein
MLNDAGKAELARVQRLHGTVDLLGVELGGKATMTEMEEAKGRGVAGAFPEQIEPKLTPVVQ